MTFTISTPRSPRNTQWVMSDCQHSLGSAAWNRMKLDRGRFLGSGTTQPRRRSTRMMVLTEGAVPWRLARWKWMVEAPASSPSSASCLRMRTISSSISKAVAVGERCGRLERGSYNITVLTLLAIAMKLNTSLLELFAGAAKRQ